MAAGGAGAYPIRPFDMKLVLKAVLVGGDPQPLTVGTQVEWDRERLALYHAPSDAHADSAVLAVRAESAVSCLF